MRVLRADLRVFRADLGVTLAELGVRQADLGDLKGKSEELRKTPTGQTQELQKMMPDVKGNK